MINNTIQINFEKIPLKDQLSEAILLNSDPFQKFKNPEIAYELFQNLLKLEKLNEHIFISFYDGIRLIVSQNV